MNAISKERKQAERRHPFPIRDSNQHKPSSTTQILNQHSTASTSTLKQSKPPPKPPPKTPHPRAPTNLSLPVRLLRCPRMPCLSRSIQVRLFRRGPLSLRELQVFHAPALRGCYLCRRRRIYRPPAPRRRGSHRGGPGCFYCSPRFRQPPRVDIFPFSRSTYGVAGTPPSPSLHLARWSSCPWRVPLRPWSWSTPALGPSGSHVGGAPGCWRLRRLSCCTRALGRSGSQVAGALGCCRLRRLSCRTLAIPATPAPDRWQPVSPATKAPGYFSRLRRLSCQCSEPLSREPLSREPLIFDLLAARLAASAFSAFALSAFSALSAALRACLAAWAATLLAWAATLLASASLTLSS